MLNDLCIYCLYNKLSDSKGVEHVIPQSFGKYGPQTPTLSCVCDECNSYFGEVLDCVLARDSLEGVTRYSKGITSSERRRQKNIQVQLEEAEDLGIFAGASVEGIDGYSCTLMPVISQFRVFNYVLNKFDTFSLNDLHDLKLSPLLYGEQHERICRVIASTEQEKETLISTLNEIGIPYNEKSTYDHNSIVRNNPKYQSTVGVHIESKINNTTLRAIAKIVFNVATYYMHPDEMRNTKWNSIRSYIRYNTEYNDYFFDTNPFWPGYETYQYRLKNDSINVKFETHRCGTVGSIQFYNLLTYHFLLNTSISINGIANFGIRFTPGEQPYRLRKGLQLY